MIARARACESERERAHLTDSGSSHLTHGRPAEASKAVGREGETSSSLTHRSADSSSKAVETCQLILLGLFRRDIRSLLILLALFRRDIRSLLASILLSNIRADSRREAVGNCQEMNIRSLLILLGLFRRDIRSLLLVSFWQTFGQTAGARRERPKKKRY